MKRTLVIIFLLYAVNVQATTWYADASRPNDSATCTQAQTLATAKKTIKAALACVGTTLGGGANDVVEVVAGTYTDADIGENGTMPSGTSWNAPFTLRARSSTQNDTTKGPTGDVVTIASTGQHAFDIYPLGGGVNPRVSLYAIIQGFRINGIGSTSASVVFTNNFIRFTNNEIYDNAVNNAMNLPDDSNEILNNKIHGGTFLAQGGAGGDLGYAMYIGGSNNLVARNELYSLPSWAIHQFSSNDSPDSNIYHSNIIRDFGQSDNRAVGIMLGSGNNNIAYNNAIYRSQGAGIGTFHGDGNKFYNNTVHGTNIGASLESSATNLELKNNIFSNNATNIKRSLTPDSFATSGNLTNYCTSTGGATDCQLTQAGVGAIRLADPTNGDMRLCIAAGNPHANCAGASPAIDVGTTLSAVFTIDIVSTARPVGSAWDIGAYEAGNTSPVEPTPAVVLQISCDNAVTDSSGNGNNGTLTNGATYNAAGQYSQACSFDGTNDNVTVADSATLDLTHGFTLAAWVKPSSVTNDAAVIVKNPSRFFLFSSIDGYCGTNAVMAGFSTATTTFYACYSTALTTNVWTHLAATYDRTAITIYVNGAPVTTAAASAFIPTNSETVQIGGSVFNEYFTGLIDEPYIKNAALSAASVATLMNTPVNPLTPNTVVIKVSGGSTWKYNDSSVVKYGSPP